MTPTLLDIPAADHDDLCMCIECIPTPKDEPGDPVEDVYSREYR